jgi:hypothetical protein
MKPACRGVEPLPRIRTSAKPSDVGEPAHEAAIGDAAIGDEFLGEHH